ncbi:MAG TPA: M56 family metallopeptidase [Gemmatimonadaceae bacterium]|jgi:HEAT repeat protein/beta-lactamase regulating signal transducer with metallopeptidase domain
MSAALFSGTGPLLLFIAKATLVLIAALGATFLLRRNTAGERHLVWLAALVGMLALPLLARIPMLHIGILPRQLAAPVVMIDEPATTIIVAGTPADAAPAVATVGAGTTVRIGSSTIVTSLPGGLTVIGSNEAAPALAPVAPLSSVSLPVVPTSILQTIAIVWAGVALSLLAWLAFGALQVRRIVKTATELTSPDWTMPLCEVADRLDLEQPPRLVVSDRIEMAFACRLLSPTVVLPVASENWTDDRRRAVLFHELAHVKRHDLVSHTLGRIACALYWFHPLVWTAARNLRNESEKACDDLVLSCGARASDYAQHLLDMVTSVRNHGAPALGIPMARKKEFEGRMLAILDPAIRRVSAGRMQAVAVIAGLGALSLTIAAVSPARANDAELPPPQATLANFDSTGAFTAIAMPDTDGVRSAVAPRAAASSASASSESSSSASVGAGAGASASASANSGDVSIGVAPRAAVSAYVTSEGAPRGGDRLGRALGMMTSEVVKGTLAGLGVAPQARVAAADTGRIALLIKVLQTDSDAGVRRAAAWGLAEVPTTGARDALVRALESDSDNQVREMSAWALGDNGSQDAAGALARALSHDSNSRVRQTSAWALGQAGRRADADALMSAVSDADPQVRETSIWALGQLDLRRAPPTLINALSDNSSQVREIAAWSLGQIGDTAAVRPLTRAFQSETDAKVKRMYLWSLSEIGTAPTDVIESAMKSSDPELRRHAVSLLTDSGGGWPMPMPRPMPRPRP